MTWKVTPIVLIIILIIIKLESAVQGRERVRTLLSVRRPQPHTTIPLKEEKDKIIGDKKERADRANRKALALLLEPASPTPSYTGSSKIVPKRHQEWHKGSAILRGPTTRRHERVPMSNQSTTSNTRLHVRQRQCIAQRMHWVTLNLKEHAQLCYRSTMDKVALYNTTR